MESRRLAAGLVALACLAVAGAASAEVAFPGKDIGQLYDRIAADVRAGRPVGFPGAWTAEAILAGIADGKSMKELFHSAAAAFAAGKPMSLGAVLGSFAYGD